MITVDAVSYRINKTPILRDISLDVPKGGITALIGPNGAGKSTLLSLIARLLPLQDGRIAVDGLPVDRTESRRLAKTLAILRQDPTVASRLRVRELVGFGRFPHSRGRLTDADRAAIDRALQRFDLADLAERFTDTLSGGQRQRAVVAMAFCQGTDYLLLDEPLNNLDIYYARDLMRTLRQIADTEGRTILIVLHDLNFAAAYADRIVAMKTGRIVAHGPAGEIIDEKILEAVYGYPMRIGTIDDVRMVLHHV